MHTDTGRREELATGPCPFETRGHFVGEPDCAGDTAGRRGVAAVAEAACVGAEETAVELDGAHFLQGSEVGGVEGGQEGEGWERAGAADGISGVLRDVLVAG